MTSSISRTARGRDSTPVAIRPDHQLDKEQIMENGTKDQRREVNAVFKGGGARGIAYAGALEVCEALDFDMRSVAGSSAGAITAMLVACDLTVDQIKDAVPEALGTLDGPLKATVKLWRRSLLSSRKLESWLESTLRACVHGPDVVDDAAMPPVTFRQLQATTGRRLYVVAMDLGTRQPVVFSPDLSPDMSVAAAVVASSSIPAAFPARRFRTADETRRLVDGGVWANYPSFVFTDSDFRTHHDQTLTDDDETRRDTIGFSVQVPDVEARRKAREYRAVMPARSRETIRDRGSAARELGWLGALLSWQLVRFPVVAAIAVLVSLSSLWLRREAERGFPFFADLPEATQHVALLLLVGVLATGAAGLVVIGLFVARFGRGVFDTGAVGATAAMGTGPSVPYWVGSATALPRHDGRPWHRIVRIDVPRRLRTLSMRPSRTLQEAAISAGRVAAAETLSDLAVDAGAVVAWTRREARAASSASPTRDRSIVAAAADAVVLIGAPMLSVVAATLLLGDLVTGGSRFSRLALETLVISIATTAWIWRAAAARARRAKRSWGTGDTSDRRPWLGVAAWATAAAVIGVLAWTFLPHYSPVAAYRAERVQATTLTTHGGMVDLDVGAMLSRSEIEQLVANASGGLARRCQPRDTCLSLLSDPFSPVAAGAVVDLHHDIDRGLAVLSDHLWTWPGWHIPAFLLILVVSSVAAATSRARQMWPRTHRERCAASSDEVHKRVDLEGSPDVKSAQT